jgi:type IV pilus assembly protein PilC
MALFDYTGQLESGAAFQGTLEAASQPDAERLLAEMGVRSTSLRPAMRNAFVAPLSLSDFAFFNDQVAALARAGIALPEGLRQLAADAGSRKLRRVLLDLAEDVEHGTPLDQAVDRQQLRFPPRYAGVVRAGLKAGDLGSALYGLSAHLRLKSVTRQALIEIGVYPLVILAGALWVLSFLMRYVAPAIADTIRDYSTYGGDVRRSTALDMIDAMTATWPVIEVAILAVVIGVPVVFLLTLLPGGGRVREIVLRLIPGVRQIYWSSVIARFAHTSAIGAYAGLPLPALMRNSAEASGSVALRRATERAAARLESGQPVEAACAPERAIPPLWTCMVAASGPRGELPGAMEELARTCELRAQQWVGTTRVVLGPLLLLLVGLTLGGLIMAMISMMTSLISGLQ